MGIRAGQNDSSGKAAQKSLRDLAPPFAATRNDALIALAQNSRLRERELLRLLARRDLPAEALAEIAKSDLAQSNAAVRLALVRHPRTPRRISLPLLKFLFLFDLVKVCQTSGVPADVKLATEDLLLKRAAALPRGERISLARRAPGRVAAALLAVTDRQQIVAALENPFITEGDLLKVLASERIPAVVVESLATHLKWSRRYALRLALVRHPLTPFHAILGWLPDLTVRDLREICLDRRMTDSVRRYVLAHCDARTQCR